MLNRRVLTERVEKWLSPIYWNDINLHSALFIDSFNVENLLVYEPTGENRPPIKEVIKVLNEFRPCCVGDSFGPSWTTKWFCFEFVVPLCSEGKTLCLFWDSNSEAMLYDHDGNPVQAYTGGHGDDRREYCIFSRNSVPGSRLIFYIEMACNGMFGNGNGGMINPPDPNRMFTLAKVEISIMNEVAHQLFWDMVVLYDVSQALPEDNPTGTKAIELANTIINKTNIRDSTSLLNARNIADELFQTKLLLSNNMRYKIDHEITAVGHCHIDTAWLWPYAETRRKVVRSWSTQALQLSLYPFWKFVASQTVQWEWLKEDNIDLFHLLKEHVRKGSIVPIGCTYVEFDANIPSGESMVRQFLYGIEFFREEFENCYSKVFWLPDTFGYSGQLPQIMRGFGIKYFMSQKLSWNLFNK